MENDHLYPHQRAIMDSLTQMVKDKQVLRLDIEHHEGLRMKEINPVIICPKNLTPTGRFVEPDKNLAGMFSTVNINPYFRGAIRRVLRDDPVTYLDVEADVLSSMYERIFAMSCGRGGKLDLRPFLFPHFNRLVLFDEKPKVLPAKKKPNPLIVPSLLATAIGFTAPQPPLDAFKTITPNLEWPYVLSKNCKLFK